MGPLPRTMPQLWTAYSPHLTRSLWLSEIYIVFRMIPQTMPNLMEPHLPNTPGPGRTRSCRRHDNAPRDKIYFVTGRESLYLAKTRSQRKEKRDTFDSGKKPPGQKIATKSRTTRHKLSTRGGAPPLTIWAPCPGHICALSLYLHFPSRMQPLCPNPVKRWGPHPERCPGVSDK